MNSKNVQAPSKNRSPKMITVATEVSTAATTAPTSVITADKSNAAGVLRTRRFAAAQPVMLSRMNTPAA